MTLEYVLRAAVNSMVRGHHVPHCYHAHEPGKGYVNDGENLHTRPEYLRQLERAATSEVENMGYAPGYAEPGYEQPRKGVLMADWNVLPRRFDEVLERLGYSVEWSDEWATCEDCNRAVRTQPDGWDWKPGYQVDESEIVCKECWAEAHPPEEESEEEESDEAV